MSVLKKFGEIALLLTFMIFCMNGLMVFFAPTYIPEPNIPLNEMIADYNNMFVDSDTNESYVLQATSLSTRPIDLAYAQNTISTLAIGFPLKIIALFSEYELGGIGIFLGGILLIIQIIGILYFILAAIGTPLGGSVP